MQQICVKKPVYNGKRISEYGLIINFPTEKCSPEERDYMRAKYICKLLEWKKAEMEEQKKVKAV